MSQVNVHAADASARNSRERWYALLVCMAGGFIVFLDVSIVNVALPTISAQQQVLQPVRPAVPGRLGDRPAVVIFQFHQQAAEHLAAGLAGLPPGKAPGHPSQQVRQQHGPGRRPGERRAGSCRWVR